MPITLAERLARIPLHNLPLRRAVTIRWNDWAVPFIFAEHDDDLAFVLGIVHAHLREGLLAIGKCLAYGRLSEMIGPFGWKLDATLRVLGFGRAAEIIEPKLPTVSRIWLQRFVDGLNWYQDHVRARPPEYRLLGIKRERWTIRDLLAIGRVAGADINWLTLFGLLPLRKRPDWPAIWQRALRAGGTVTSFEPLAELLRGASRTGSNSVVVAGCRSATGGALLASDPHLSLLLPNLWLLAGVRSPSCHVVGLMPAGLPIFGLGRNEHMAWAGTNMRAAASDLYDVSGVNADALEVRTERLRTRFWRDRRIRVRTSALGPIVSDAPLIRTELNESIALRWVGTEPSDEVGAFLAVARARTPADFRNAFGSYAAGGQNMQFADREGNIGQVMAVWLPRRAAAEPKGLVLDPGDPELQWQGIATAVDLPWCLNPDEGVLASANNPPTRLDFPISYFFINSERAERLQHLLAGDRKLLPDDLRKLQQDIVSPASLKLKDQLVTALDAAGVSADNPGFVERLRAWNGRYGADDCGPVAFESLLHRVITDLRTEPQVAAGAAQRDDWSELVANTAEDLQALPPAVRGRLLHTALSAAAKDASRFARWGDMHRLRIQHVLGLAPLIGRAFRIADLPASGSRETVMKAAHGLVHQRHTATYGSQARFVADMADPDGTYAVLLGGQDGWLRSQNFADQLPLWRRGDYIRLPMTTEAVEREFRHIQVLQPAP